MPNISDLKRYAVVDSSEDDFVLEKCMAAAERYLFNAGVPAPTEENPLYDLCVYQLAVHYYDNRGAAGDKVEQLPFGVGSIIHQLRL